MPKPPTSRSSSPRPTETSSGGDDSPQRLERLLEIGIALSSERDLGALLRRTVRYARELTRADAGTLYTREAEGLSFRILQNHSLGIDQGGDSDQPVTLESVPLVPANVSAFVALTGRTVRIADVYTSRKFDFEGPRQYDARTGYRSRSMLVVPLRVPDGEVIGVLQLINATDPRSRRVAEFQPEDERLAQALASQAAVAITNARLLVEVRTILDSMVRVLGAAVDAKSPHTGNHVQRVAELNVMLAEAIGRSREGPFADVQFTRAEIEEIRVAGWLHDVGKVTTPVHIMDKATKLQGVYDRIDLLRERFRRAAAAQWGTAVEQAAIRALEGEDLGIVLAEEKGRAAETVHGLLEDLAFLERCNRPEESMDEVALERLRAIGEGGYLDADGAIRPLLEDDELAALSVRRGSLTEAEIGTMREHARWTETMLSQIPFTDSLHNVATYASQHHEKLNGSGYPRGLKAEDLSLQSRILAIADFYEALSAKDRPYKQPMDPDMVLAILRRAAAAGEIDGEILEFMIRERIHEKFEQGAGPEPAG